MIPILFANSIAADAGLIPGLAIFGPAMGLPLSVLAAFVERPFVTRAGFGKNAIWFSLQANFVSLLVGYVATMIVIPFIMSPGVIVGLVWPFLAVGISIASERLYLEFRSRNRCPWAPVAWGNIISAVTCVVVMVVAATLRGSVRQLCAVLRRHETVMNVGVAISSLFLLIGAFAARTPLSTLPVTTGQNTGAADR